MEENTVRKTYVGTSTTVVVPAGVTRLKVLTMLNGRQTSFIGKKWLQADGTLMTAGGVTPSLGTGATPSSSPTLITPGLSYRTLTRISNVYDGASSAHIAVIDKNGTLFLWGANNNGQLGNASTTAQNAPVAVAPSVVGYVPLKDVWTPGAAATGFTVARDFQNRLFVWGLISGDSVAPPRSSPTLVAFPAGVSQWVQVVCAGATTRNAMVMQGDNGAWYALGTHPNFGTGGVNQSWSSPTLVLNSSQFVACIGIQDNTIAWKDNQNRYWMSSGAFTGAESSPIQVVPGNGTIVNFWMNPYMISNPRVHCQDSTGAVFTFGDNVNGQVGDNTVVTKSSWVQVIGLPNNVNFAYTGHSTTANQCFCFFKTTDGKVYSTGWNANGGLGVGDALPRSTATLVVGLGAVSVAEVVTGYGANNTAFFLTTLGLLYAVGFNGSGFLGLNDTTARSTPTLVVGGRSWAAVVNAVRAYDANPLSVQKNYPGVSIMFAVDLNGVLCAWGSNANGELSDGTVTGRSSPVPVVRPYFVGDGVVYDKTNYIDVVPGQSYVLNLLALRATFGSTVIGQFVDTAIIEYDS